MVAVNHMGGVLPDEAMPAGSLVREFKHLAVDLFVIEEDGKKKLQVEAHFGKRKALASIRTVCSHVQVSRGIHLSVHMLDWHGVVGSTLPSAGRASARQGSMTVA